MICYHHNDLDGRAAAYLVGKFSHNFNMDSFKECDYQDKFDKHGKNDVVFIVDISISESTYQMLIDTCKSALHVIWIDHHATSIDLIKRHGIELMQIPNLDYFVSNCACGAVLTYAFFKTFENPFRYTDLIDTHKRYSEINASYEYSEESSNGFIHVTAVNGFYVAADKFIKIPKWLFHVDDYDCWKNIDISTNRFKLGTDACNTKLFIRLPNNKQFVVNPFWDDLFEYENKIYEYIENGTVIQKYLESRYADELEKVFEKKIDGTTFICKNAMGNSWNFADLLKKYDAAILFNFNGKTHMWTYSIYSDENSKFDCKKFAEKYGGGGHVHAAGFSSEMLIFVKYDIYTFPPLKS